MLGRGGEMVMQDLSPANPWEEERVMEGALILDDGGRGDSGLNGPGILCLSASSTRMETIRFLHRWKIEQFSVQLELSEVGVELKSQSFGSDDGRYRFLLKLFPAGRDDECRGYLSLYLQILQCPHPRLRFRVNFYIDTTEGPKSCTLNKNVVTINKGGTVTASKFFGTDSLKSRAHRYMPDDTLTVGVELTVFGTSENSSLTPEDEVGAGSAEPSRSLASDLGKLLRDDTHADCALMVGARKFSAHKGILAARSPVFAAMFAHSEMAEAQKSEAQLEDVTPDAVEGMLEWMYTQRCPILECKAEEVLAAADKYDLGPLKDECEVVLGKDLGLHTVCARLRLADHYSAPTLRKRATAFLRRHKLEVLQSSEWGELESGEPLLAAAVLKELVVEPGLLHSSSTNDASSPSHKRPRLS